jgi:toxin ParE1/3/4
MRIVLSARAKIHLADIYNYTAEVWGERQADRYLAGVLEAIDQVASGTRISRSIKSEFDLEGFSIRYQKHFIYWKQLSRDRIGVVAILHASMIQGDRLREAFELGFEDE